MRESKPLWLRHTHKINDQMMFLITVLRTVLSVLRLVSSSVVIFYWVLHFPFNKYSSVLLPSSQVSIPWVANATQQSHQRTPVRKRSILKLLLFRPQNWGTPDEWLERSLPEKSNILVLLYLWSTEDWKCCPENGSGKSETEAWKMSRNISVLDFPL